MGVYREIIREQIWRVFAALPCFAIGYYVFCHSGRAGMLFSMPFAFAGAIIMVPFFTNLVAEPFRALFYPGERFKGPQPMYGQPASKRAWGEYEEAIRGYEELARKYPDDLKPYIEMLHIAAVDLRDEARAKAIFDKALTVLTKEDDKTRLKLICDDNISLLHSTPEWLATQQQRVLTPPDLKDQAPVDEPDGRLKRRFHAGGYGKYEGPDAPRYVDWRKPVHYEKKDSPAPSGPPAHMREHGQHEEPDARPYVDWRKKIPYQKQEPDAQSRPPDSAP
jgi:hypothetical protein